MSAEKDRARNERNHIIKKVLSFLFVRFIIISQKKIVIAVSERVVVGSSSTYYHLRN